MKRKKSETPVIEDKIYTGIPANVIAPSFSAMLFDIENQRHPEYVFPGGRSLKRPLFSVYNLLIYL